MNKDITKNIEQYLVSDTNYAIIINGDYGIGKTFYVKNELFPIVSGTEIPNNEDIEFYKPVLISLFGIKSIEELQSQILAELYPFLKSKGMKIASGFLTSALKAWAGTDFTNMLSDSDVISKNVLSFKKIFICIDDIDRKSETLQLKEIFGFINNLVENSNAKVMLIANEDELRKEANIENTDSYSILREKVIGITFNFKTNVSLVYDNVIEAKYNNSAYIDYCHFLKNKKENIIKVIGLNKDNLRNLVFFFEHFKIIFFKLKDLILKNEELKEIKDDLLESILNFSLPITIEYKQGRINAQNASEIPGFYKRIIIFDESKGFALKTNSPESKPKVFKDEFREKYLDFNKYQNLYFQSIFNHIIGLQYLDSDNLLSDIKQIYKFSNNQIPRHQQVIEELKYWNFIDLSFKEYKDLTFEMLKYVDKGEYGLEQYTTVFSFCIRFENKLRFDLSKLKKRFQKGINKNLVRFVADLEFYISVSPEVYCYQDVVDVMSYCITKNENLRNIDKKISAEELFNLFESDYGSFSTKFENNENEFKYIPFFDNISFSRFIKCLKKMKNTDLINLAYLFSRRFSRHFSTSLNCEKDFLIRLQIKIEAVINSKKTPKMDVEAYKILLDKISYSLSNFQNEA